MVSIINSLGELKKTFTIDFQFQLMVTIDYHSIFPLLQMLMVTVWILQFSKISSVLIKRQQEQHLSGSELL